MDKIKQILIIILGFVLVLSVAIDFSGDAKVRPRLDKKFNYPTSKINVTVLNNNSVSAIRRYYKLEKLILKPSITIDNKMSNKHKVEKRDTYRAFLNYGLNKGNIEMTSTVMAISEAENNVFSVKDGIKTKMEGLFGLSFKCGLYYSNRSIQEAGKYDDYMTHLKISRSVGKEV